MLNWKNFDKPVLYHYSDRKFSVIESTREQARQGVRRSYEKHSGPEFDSMPGAYEDHVSAMFSPFPWEMLRRFPSDYWFCRTGRVYEYRIDVRSLRLISYYVAETPLEVGMYDRGELVTTEDFEHLSAVKERNRWVGGDASSLLGACYEFGDSRRHWDALTRREDFPEVVSGYYSICVPHVLLWLEGGKVRPVSRRLVRK